jgi:hypothetical protein
VYPDEVLRAARGLGSGPRYAGPAQAFQRFCELVESEGVPFGDTEPEDYLNFLRPFLVNPDRHEQHVRAIADAAAAAQMARTMTRLPGTRLLRPLVRRQTKASLERLLVRYDALRQQLLAEVEPGELAFDMLPARKLPAAPEWERNQRLWLLQAKMAIHPSAGFQPDSLSLRLELDSHAQLVAQLPASEMIELGIHEVQLSNEGQFRVTTSDTAKVGGEIGATGAKVVSELGHSDARELTLSTSGSHKVTYTARVARVIASAVGSVARWEMLGTGEERPVGGLDFYLTVLLPARASAVSIRTTALVSFGGWGPLRLEYDEKLQLPAI